MSGTINMVPRSVSLCYYIPRFIYWVAKHIRKQVFLRFEKLRIKDAVKKKHSKSFLLQAEDVYRSIKQMGVDGLGLFKNRLAIYSSYKGRAQCLAPHLARLFCVYLKRILRADLTAIYFHLLALLQLFVFFLIN